MLSLFIRVSTRHLSRGETVVVRFLLTRRIHVLLERARFSLICIQEQNVRRRALWVIKCNRPISCRVITRAIVKHETTITRMQGTSFIVSMVSREPASLHMWNTCAGHFK